MSDNKAVRKSLLEEIYPNAKAVFSVKTKSLDEIKNSSLVILDTNTLLIPYTVTKENLEVIESTYKMLVDSDRLLIPGQVAREFAQQRPTKLSEMYSQLVRRKARLSTPNYPLLASLDEYKQLLKIEAKIAKLVSEQNRKVEELLHFIRSWRWDDPVSAIYRNLFEEAVFDISTIATDVEKEQARRTELKIPPGYKDAGKKSNELGDLIIWQTILKIASEKKKDVIFVTADQKADWWYQSENLALYPRFELVDEFFRASEGATVHFLKLSQLLELFGAGQATVSQISLQEKLYEDYSVDHDYTDYIPPPYELHGMVSLYLSLTYNQKVEIRRGSDSQHLVIKDKATGEARECSYHFLPSNFDRQSTTNYLQTVLTNDPYRSNRKNAAYDANVANSFETVIASDCEEGAMFLYELVETSISLRHRIKIHFCYLCGTQDIFLCLYKVFEAE